MDELTAAALLGCVSDPDEDVRVKGAAIRSLLEIVDLHWSSIGDHLVAIESLAENEAFEERAAAASLASRCFFHLEELEDATRLALASEASFLFDVDSDTSEYASTIIGQCLERYVQERTAIVDGALKTVDAFGVESREPSTPPPTIDPRLEAVVEKLIDRCFEEKQFKRAVGVALEARRLDKLREAVVLSASPAILSYCWNIANVSVLSHGFRQQVTEEIVKLHEEMNAQGGKTNYLEWFVCLHALGQAADYAKLVERLIGSKGSDEREGIAYQALFDLMEIQDRKFEAELAAALAPPAAPEASTTAAEPAASTEEESAPLVASAEAPPPAEDPVVAARRANCLDILTNGKKTALLLDFMYKRNGTDPLILKNYKDASEVRKNSILHNAMIVAHGYAECGTTSDGFLRDNLEWLGRASNWAKFSATASIGVVHKGNVEAATTLLEPYLPVVESGTANSPYSEGGALFALGLIHAAEGVSPAKQQETLVRLEAALDAGATQAVDYVRDSWQHGACLGIGLVASCQNTNNTQGLMERLKGVVYSDSAVIGEAASLALGLVMMGGGNEHGAFLQDLLRWAHETKHEKIVRSIGLCAAFLFFRQEDKATVLIEQLLRDKDHWLRYGGVFTVGLAYLGTANNQAVQTLLHVAVSDVSNDVRRAAVMSIGFVMCRLSDRLPGLVALLSESYNPHVRYGAALALMFGCADSRNPKTRAAALDLLDGLVRDKVDFVRQGAMMATATLLQQVRPETDARTKKFRERLATVAGDVKNNSIMSRMGAMIAAGMIDAGGRNATFSLTGRSGVPKPLAVAGAVLWAQYWFWYPLMHCYSLALTPSAIVGVNLALDLPKSFKINVTGAGGVHARFGFPERLVPKKEEVKQRVKTAVLSVSNKKPKGGAAAANSAGANKSEEAAPAAANSMEVVTPETPSTPKDESALLTNPIRVTHPMLNFVAIDWSARYVPVVPDYRPSLGIVVLRDSRPNDPPEVVTKVAPPPMGDVDPNEPDPPEPFEWTPPPRGSTREVLPVD